MNNTLKGMTMAGLAAVFWGSMGVAGQYLLQNCHFTEFSHARERCSHRCERLKNLVVH